MIIDCISDLHGFYPILMGGDLLILAGDYTAADKLTQWAEFFQWLKKQEYEKKILIAGNHDNFLANGMPANEKAAAVREIQDLIDLKEDEDFEYLCDSGTEFEGLKIWGSPGTPWFQKVNHKCQAFMQRDLDLWDCWDKIPAKVDILITHGPAYGILDGIEQEDGSMYHCGSKSLYNWLKYVERPRVHICGHIHEGYGIEEHFVTYNDEMMLSVNCSYIDGKYRPMNKPIRIEL